MKKNKFILLGLLGLLALSSCGIFHKSCGCPTFGNIDQHAAPHKSPSFIA
ncbi:hypothetical protein [Mucilaginibacter sp.]|nr:hypothetical protein [Mucilaginibacter sp.]MDB4921639.1 hypothetical protein [Mucilaginibacter sp.]